MSDSCEAYLHWLVFVRIASQRCFTSVFNRFKFHGPSSMTLPSALGIQEEEMVQFKQS